MGETPQRGLMNAPKFGLAAVLVFAACSASPVLANMAAPARVIVHAPVTLSEPNSKKLQPLLKALPASEKTEAGAAVIVACPERQREGAYACVIKITSPRVGRRRQMSVDGDNALVLRGKLELAAETLRRSPAGTQASSGRAACPDGQTTCVVSLDDPEGKSPR